MALVQRLKGLQALLARKEPVHLWEGMDIYKRLVKRYRLPRIRTLLKGVKVHC